MTQKIACITLDMERDYGDPAGRIRLLEQRGFLERYIEIVNRFGAKVTMFTVTALFESHGSDIKQLADRIPLELAVHSHNHNPANACGRDEIEASTRAFQRFTGRMPLGYRAPVGQIHREGLNHLLDFGYAYDASVYTSIRPGRFGYWNLHMPNTPFRVTRGNDSLIEFPFTSLSKIRIPFALSYIKLLGWGLYSALMKISPLPDVVVALSHPHDFYFHLLKDNHRGLEKMALARNARKAFDYFEKMISFLEQNGYAFYYVSEAYRTVREGDLQQIALADWR